MVCVQRLRGCADQRQQSWGRIAGLAGVRRGSALLSGRRRRGGSSGYLVPSQAGHNGWRRRRSKRWWVIRWTGLRRSIPGGCTPHTGERHLQPGDQRGFCHHRHYRVSRQQRGAALCADTNGNYYPAGVYLGGTANTVVRAIDGSVAELINWANVSANTGANHVGGGVVNLSSGGGGGFCEPGSFPDPHQPGGGDSRRGGLADPALSASSYYSNNSAVYELPAGNYTVVFRAAAGTYAATNATLNVVGGQAVTLNITYAAATGPTVPGSLARPLPRGCCSSS